MSDRFHWARLLAFVSGLVNQELLLRNEYLAAENRILRAPPAESAPAVGCGAVHLGRDRQTTRPSSSAGYRTRGQAGYRGGADLARTGDVLRAVLHRTQQPTGIIWVAL